MKRHLPNSLRVLFLPLAVLLSLPMLAEKVEIDGINYDLVTKAKLATVIKKSSGKYSGEVVIPESVEFKGVAHSVTSIGEEAFRGCDGLTSVTIPNSVTSIGNYAFYNCDGLTSVTIGSGVTSIGEWAFAYCDALTSVTIPNSVTSIGEYAFYGCDGLTSVTIGSGVTSIGEWAFTGCSGLTSVHISDIAAWCNVDFAGSSSNPFSYAHHLYLNGEEVKDLVIPNSVTSIGEEAFYGCSGLTSVTIGNSVTSIGNKAFSSCTGLTSVTIGNSVTSIGRYAFEGCSGLTSVTIGNSVTSIGRYAFEGCSGLTSVTIPNSVTSIGVGAFEGCSGLTSVTIGNSVTSIEGCAFMYCTGLTSVHISDIAAWCNIDFDGTDSNPLYYAHHLFLNGEEVKDLVIPNSVKSIGEEAFYFCKGLTSVTIGNSVTSIGSSAFSRCSGLTSVHIGNSVKSIGYEAFEYCTGLTSVHISDIAAWCNIDFGDNPLWRAQHLYVNGEEVKDLVIPNSVTSIGYAAFRDCSGLTSVTIGNSVTSIGDQAFYECSGLTSVTIGNSVKSIGGIAFSGCSGLTSVTIGNGVTSIEYKAFANCSELLDVYCYAEKVPSTDSYAFDGSYPEYATLHVPDASIDSYKATEPWSGFGKIVALTPEETGIDELKGENGKVKTAVYDLSGRRVQKGQKGIFIRDGKVVAR